MNGPAIEDYALATQTARVENDSSWNVAQAHYLRGMLLYQAVPGFRTWFGVDPTVDDALRRFVAADLLTT